MLMTVGMNATMKGSIGAGKTLLSSLKKNKFEEALNEDIDPPYCMSIRLVGHSFPPGS